jgi:hypothetical protein
MPSKYEKQYKPALKSIMVNDHDPDLSPIKIELPPIPKLRTIEGYGLPPEDQKFTRLETPEQLRELERNPKLETIDDIWEILDEDQDKYEESILFINKMINYRHNGMWFFNNGVPTYITGDHFFYLSCWYLDSGLPEYRSRDMKFFLMVWYGQNDPDCLGITYPKHRREGATSKTQCWLYNTISQRRDAHGGMQSMTEKHAEGVFQDHLVKGWKKVPFYFRPRDEGATNPKKELRFSSPPRRSAKGSIINREEVLESYIDFETSNVGAYDTYKLIAYHGDEVGKTKEVNVNTRHGIVKQCLTLGGGKKIIGFSIYTSTVGEMDKGGGKEFFKMCQQSHYDHWKDELKRNKNNRTASGLYLLFIPAFDGLEGFIDEYGNSVIETPKKPVMGIDGVLIDVGAKEYLKNTRDDLREKDDIDGLSEAIRMYPIAYRECFRVSADKCKFNPIILEERLDEFAFGNDTLVKGNFEWENDIPDGKVIWVPSENGKFKASKLLKPEESNLYYMDDYGRMPGNNDRYSAGADPFKFKETRNGKKSDGGGAVFQLKDIAIDHTDKPIKEWESHGFACTYKHRPPTKIEYGEDMLMMCIYYGCMINVEINVPFLWEYFDERGYHNYLYYEIDRKSGLAKATPGTNTNGAAIDDIFREYHTYIEKHGHREKHDDLLRECYEIDEDMGDYDLFVAGGLSLLQVKSKNIYGNQVEKPSDSDISDYVWLGKI